MWYSVIRLRSDESPVWQSRKFQVSKEQRCLTPPLLLCWPPNLPPPYLQPLLHCTMLNKAPFSYICLRFRTVQILSQLGLVQYVNNSQPICSHKTVNRMGVESLIMQSYLIVILRGKRCERNTKHLLLLWIYVAKRELLFSDGDSNLRDLCINWNSPRKEMWPPFPFIDCMSACLWPP